MKALRGSQVSEPGKEKDKNVLPDFVETINYVQEKVRLFMSKNSYKSTYIFVYVVLEETFQSGPIIKCSD